MVDDYPKQKFYITDLKLSPCEKYLLVCTKLKGVIFEVEDILKEELFIVLEFSLEPHTTLLYMEWSPQVTNNEGIFITLNDVYQLCLYSLTEREKKLLPGQNFLTGNISCPDNLR